MVSGEGQNLVFVTLFFLDTWSLRMVGGGKGFLLLLFLFTLDMEINCKRIDVFVRPAARP